jgi:hypothetical protein
VEIPDVQYARSGDVAIAYQVVGEGPLDFVFVRGTLADPRDLRTLGLQIRAGLIRVSASAWRQS